MKSPDTCACEHHEALSPGEEKSALRREVIGILDRACNDAWFCRELLERGSAALGDYRLSPEAKSAIAGGDLHWINENVGELTQKQLVFIYKRLDGALW